jgi:DNA replication initiation complex subunit (GINS family)
MNIQNSTSISRLQTFFYKTLLTAVQDLKNRKLKQNFERSMSKLTRKNNTKMIKKNARKLTLSAFILEN